MSTPITAVTVSDSPLVIEGLRAMLAPFVERVDVIASELGEIPRSEADTILLDAFGHPDEGLGRVREAKDSGRFAKVALLVWRITEVGTQQALAAGADAVLSKSSTADHIVGALEAAVAGEIVVDPFPNQMWPDKWLKAGSVHLTPREVQLLALVANGLTNREIGSVLFIAESSAKTYIKRIYKKLDIRNRAQATLCAVELGLAGPDVDHLA